MPKGRKLGECLI